MAEVFLYPFKYVYCTYGQQKYSDCLIILAKQVGGCVSTSVCKGEGQESSVILSRIFASCYLVLAAGLQE